MNQNAVLGLAPKLAQAVADDDWKAALVLAADVLAAMKEQQPFTQWSPWTPGNSHKPGSAF